MWKRELEGDDDDKVKQRSLFLLFFPTFLKGDDYFLSFYLDTTSRESPSSFFVYRTLFLRLTTEGKWVVVHLYPPRLPPSID